MIADDFNLVANLFYFLYVFIFQVICQLSQWRTYLQAGILTKDANYGNYEFVAFFCEYEIKNRSTISLKFRARNKKGLFVIIIYRPFYAFSLSVFLIHNFFCNKHFQIEIHSWNYFIPSMSLRGPR